MSGPLGTHPQPSGALTLYRYHDDGSGDVNGISDIFSLVFALLYLLSRCRQGGVADGYGRHRRVACGQM